MAAAYASLLAAVREHGMNFTSPVADETDEDYLKRLVAVTASLPLRAFEALPSEAQFWYDAAADALQAGFAVPVPDGFDRGINQQQSGLGSGRIARPSASAAAARHILPSHQPAAAEPEIPAIDRSEPLSTQVSRLMIADPSLSIDTVMRLLRAVGVAAQRGSVVTLRNQALTFLRIIREAGWRPSPLGGQRG